LLDDEEHTVAEGQNNGTQEIQLDPMQVIGELEQIAPQLVELAKERVARKLLEQQNRALMQALQEQARPQVGREEDEAFRDLERRHSFVDVPAEGSAS
jgi:hypothetical protein